MKRIFRPLLSGVVFLVLLAVLFLISLGPIGHGRGFMYTGPRLQQARTIGMIMFNYATDNVANGNAYPSGNSSTEVFQKLIDAGYCSDPTIFYIPMAGKAPSSPGQRLKPENVCWDVTGGVPANPPAGLPLVFMTGYRVTYEPGTAAVPIIKPFPDYGEHFFLEWLPWGNHEFDPIPGIAAFYTGSFAKFEKLEPLRNRDGSVSIPEQYPADVGIPNFVPSDFKPDGKTYRQLTPDGVLK